MKVYLAGFRTIEKLWNKPTKDIYLLSSYLEHMDKSFGEYVKQENHILDSGAYTFLAKKQGKKINWESYVISYGKFIREHDIKLFFELDIDPIVGLAEVERLRYLLEKVAGKKCIPVWHKSRGLEYWHRMCHDYEYVAIGGIVTKEIKKSQYDVFVILLDIAKKYKTKVHGLGFTNLKGLKRYKFYSVDSTNWITGRFGSVGPYVFTGDTLKNIKRPENMVKKDQSQINLFSFSEWVKFQKYAENYL
jgi:hypothetical protein